MKATFKEKLFLLLIIIVGTVLRYDFAAPHNFIIDSDEAIVGLMAKHILEGKPIPTFYYGQHYMGSLEAILSALSFSLIGISNMALKLTPFIFSIILIPLIYFITKRLSNVNTALIAALLTSVPPTPLVVWSSKARGGFIEVIVIGALALLTTIVWMQQKRPKLLLTALTGFLLGLGWWVNNQIIYFIAPIGLAFLEHLIYLHDLKPKIKSILTHGCVGFLTFILGGLPFWIYNLNNDFVTFAMFAGAESKDLSQHVSGLFTTALPIILGGLRFWQEEEYFPGGSQIALFVYGLLFFTALVLTFKSFLRFITFRGIDDRSPRELLIVFVFTTLLIFSLSSFGYLVQAPRYLLPIYVGLMPLAAIAISKLGKIIGTTLLIIALSINLGSSYFGDKAIPGEPYVYNGERASKDHSELIKWLIEHKYPYVRTNYWIGYRLAFESKERVKFLVFQEPYQARIPEYEREGHSLNPDTIPLVLVPSQAKIVRHSLRVEGIKFRQKMISGYVVIHSFEAHHEDNELTPVDHTLESVSSNPHNENAHLALDGSVHTRWASGEHQHDGMFFTINLKQPVLLKAIRIDLGDWPHDFPRELEIILHKPDGTSSQLMSNRDYQAIRYFRFNEPIELHTEPILVNAVELRQTGSHPIFDWSIAEIELMQ